MNKKLLVIPVMILIATISAFTQKQIFFAPFNRAGDDYCNKYGNNGTISSLEDMADENERWCGKRTYQTDNLICFWEGGFGTDPVKLKNPLGGTFDLTRFIDNLETIYHFQIDEMAATHKDGESLNKYKYLILLSYTNNWIAYGGGYDYTIGAMWLNPAALGVGSTAQYPYFTLTHELFHSMSYQAYVDRKSNEYHAFQDAMNGPFWERSANHAALVKYPEVNSDFARYMYGAHSHFLNTRKHYTTSFLLEHLDEEFGISSLGKLWTGNKGNEHATQTINRVFFDGDQSKLNDFVGKTAMKNISWDYPQGSNGYFHKSIVKGIAYNTNLASNVDQWALVQKKHRTILKALDYDKRHFAVLDCQAPQDYAYNAIQIFPEVKNADGSATIKMCFRGHDEIAGKNSAWRWGFVAIQADGSPRYGTLYGDPDKTVEFTMNATDQEIWLVVAGAPSRHTNANNYTWEAGFPKYYRYPYEVCFENAVPMGYEENFEGAKTNGAPHPNGGGFVASTATVSETAYIGPNAKVLGTAKVRDNARIEDFAIVKGNAQVYGNAVVKENAMVFSNARVYGNAVVSGSARCFNNTYIYDDAFVTDNAFVRETKVYGNAIVCGNAWQRGDLKCEIGGTCVAGGDSEDMGYISGSGAELSGTYLQWPEQGNNSRSRLDGKGNLTVEQLQILKENWDNLSIRFNILNNSISTTTSSANYDVNAPYAFFTEDEISIGGEGDGTFSVTDHGSFILVSGEIPANTTYSIINEAGIEILSNEAITGRTTLSVPDKYQSGNYMIKVFIAGTEYFCGEITQY